MNKKGFTLIELLLYIGLTAIVLTAGLSLAWTVLFSQAKTTALNETNYNYQFLDNFLRKTIQEAKDINLGLSILDANPGRLVLTNSDNTTTIIETENEVINLNDQNFTLTHLKVTLPNTAKIDLLTNIMDLTNFLIQYSTTNRQITTQIKIDYYNPSDNKSYDASKTWTNTTTLRAE